MRTFFNFLIQGHESIINKLEDLDKRNVEEDDRNVEKFQNLYLEQIDGTKKQMNYEREKIAMDSEELMKNIRKLERKIEDREVDYKGEIKRQKLMFYALLFFMFGVFCGGFFLGTNVNSSLLIIINILMGLFIVYTMMKDSFERR